MKNASSFLTGQNRRTVETAIAEAEKSTSAEIVVVVATRSGRYDRAEDLFGILCGLLAISTAWITWQGVSPDTREWADNHRLTLELVPLLAMFMLWFYLGAALGTRFPVLVRPFVSRFEVEAEVRRRGFEAFHLFRIGHTQGRNGVLIYVSVQEHAAWVVGDQAINSKLPHETWEHACRAIGRSVRAGRPHEGLVEAIRTVGKDLSVHFPRAKDDQNELPNAVRFLD